MAELEAIVADYLEQSARFAPAGSDIGVEMSVGRSLANGAASGRIAAKPRCVARPALGTRRPGSIWEAVRCSDRCRQDGSAAWRSRGRVGGQTRRRPLGCHRPDGHCEGQTRRPDRACDSTAIAVLERVRALTLGSAALLRLRPPSRDRATAIVPELARVGSCRPTCQARRAVFVESRSGWSP
jgi:hypothetical protein